MREFEIARPCILGALLDAVVHGLRAVGCVQLDRLPRMADFALWATACETALWPAGTFARAYAANRRAAIESIIEADPIATCVRAIMIDRTTWTGSASDLLRLCAESARDDISGGPVGKKSPGACRSAAAGADIPPQAGHRDHVLTRRPDRDKDDQGDHEC